MRYLASEKLEIIRLVDDLPIDEVELISAAVFQTFPSLPRYHDEWVDRGPRYDRVGC